MKPLDVESGPISPCFGQPGQGVQYKLQSKISTLKADGFLEAVDPLDLLYRGHREEDKYDFDTLHDGDDEDDE